MSAREDAVGTIRSEHLSLETVVEALQRIIAEIAAGRSNNAVAESLHVSRHAVEKHTNAIFAKLGLTEDDEITRRVKAVLLFLAGQGEFTS